jgi:hypothetical protein
LELIAAKSLLSFLLIFVLRRKIGTKIIKKAMAKRGAIIKSVKNFKSPVVAVLSP